MMSMVKRDVTTIQLTVEVREYLKSKGRKGESYDDVLRRLLNIDKEEG